LLIDTTLIIAIKTSVFEPFCCREALRKCLRCSWNPMQWSKCLSYVL